MDSTPKLVPFSPLGDADPVPPSFYVEKPEQVKTLALLYEISHELTSILDREELLLRIAERVKTLVDYQVFTVMLWDEEAQMLESGFSKRFGSALPSRFQLPLNQGITGIAAAERRTIRVVDVRLDPRYLRCENDVEVRSELVVPSWEGEASHGCETRMGLSWCFAAPSWVQGSRSTWLASPLR